MNKRSTIAKTDNRPDDASHLGLTFIQRSRGGLGYDYWADVQTTGNHAKDYAIGTKLGEAYLDFIGRNPNSRFANSLASIAVCMEHNYATLGQVLGFMTRVGDAAAEGARSRYLRVMEAGNENWPQTDGPISQAVKAYRDGSEAFNKIREEDWPEHGGGEAVVAMTYGNPLDVLENWSTPATTHRDAVAALKFAISEAENFYCPPSVLSMLRAALPFLERGGTE